MSKLKDLHKPNGVVAAPFAHRHFRRDAGSHSGQANRATSQVSEPAGLRNENWPNSIGESGAQKSECGLSSFARPSANAIPLSNWWPAYKIPLLLFSQLKQTHTYFSCLFVEIDSTLLVFMANENEQQIPSFGPFIFIGNHSLPPPLILLSGAILH